MSEEKHKRVWFNVPRTTRERWLGRPIDSFNTSNRKNIGAPREFVGNGHIGWELYYHEDTIQEFVNMLKRWISATGGNGPPNGPSVPVSEILDMIARYEK